MKKIIILLTAILLVQSYCDAKDYAKLQIQEMKHAQKYNTTKKYVPAAQSYSVNLPTTVNTRIKDPKIMKFGNYEKVSKTKYDEKIKADEKEYAKIAKSLGIRTVDNYNAQAKGEDYYKVYRIAEKMIRANNLDYMNWRIGIVRESIDVNAFSVQTNYICLTTALYDTFSDNDDALALVIGHEMGHALLGHSQRSYRINKTKSVIRNDESGYVALVGLPLVIKGNIDLKNMEFGADVEGAKLMVKAGYNLDNATEVLRYFDTLPKPVMEWKNDHPNADKRIQNLKENRKLFIEDEWREIGKVNIYNSSVLSAQLSSDRKSIVINGSPNKVGRNEFYKPETPAEVYARCGYQAYVNGQFSKALEYFDELFKIDKTNASAYLYASYASEYLYKNVGKPKYLEDAKEYAQTARMLEPNNKYIIEQADSL